MFSGRGTSMGVRMTKQIKALGTSSIKTLIESDKMIINDFQLIEEMSTFSRRGNSWMAEDGCNDDPYDVSSHIWMVVKQQYFKELSNSNIRNQLYLEQQNLIEQDMSTFGFIDDGTLADELKDEVDEYGTVWSQLSEKGCKSSIL